MAAKKLPKGIVYREKDDLYMGRFQMFGERYTVYGKTVKEVAELMEETRYEVKHGIYCKPNEVTVNSWFNTWITEYKENTVKRSTIQRYTHSFKLYISPKIGKCKVCDIRPQMIQKLINDMHKKGYSKSQIKIVYAIIKGMFDQAIRNQIIIHNPLEAVILPKFKKQMQDEKRVMTLGEQRAFLEYAKDSEYYSFYRVALQTGMRINEICGLQWSDIDFKKKEIRVSGTLVYVRGKERFKDTPKSQTSKRKIPMLPDVEKILKECRKEQKINQLKFGERYKIEQGLEDIVFTYPEGGALWDTAIRCDIRKIVEKIRDSGLEFEEITPHTFRHTFATRCAEQGMPLQVLKTILGHSSLTMTADLYSHVMEDTKQKEMQKIINLF